MLVRLLLCGLLTALAASPVLAMKMYRFKVDGQTFMRDSIPPEYARLGYEVIGNNGLVQEVVPPAPSEEEIAARKVREQAEADRQARMAAQKERDVNLLRLYERPEDVERARLRKADEVSNYIGLLEKRIASFNKKLEPLLEQQASAQARNGPLPPGVEKEISDLQGGVAESEKDIRDRRDELSRITRDYAEQFERVRILQVYPAGTLYDDIDFKRLDDELAKRQIRK